MLEVNFLKLRVGEVRRVPLPRPWVHNKDGLGTFPPRVQGYRMGGVALQIAVIVILALLNGLLAMSETALVSSRKVRLPSPRFLCAARS